MCKFQKSTKLDNLKSIKIKYLDVESLLVYNIDICSFKNNPNI